MGLEITDSELRLLQLADGVVINKAIIKLPPGVLLDGEIQDKEGFSLALLELRKKFLFDRKKEELVISLPPSNLFSFKILTVSKSQDDFSDILPFNPDDHFYTLEEIGGDEQKKEYLVFWVNKNYVEQFKQLFTKIGLGFTKFEFPALALIRAAKFLKLNYKKGRDYILTLIKPDGAIFVKISDEKVNDFKFYPISTIGRQITNVRVSAENIRNIYSNELANFNDANFPIVNLNNSILPRTNLESEWIIAFGSALHKEPPAFTIGKLNWYRHAQRIIFASLFIFLLTDAILLIAGRITHDNLVKINSMPVFDKISESEEKFESLQKSSSFVNSIQNKEAIKALSIINRYAGNKIEITRVLIDHDLNVLIGGTAVNPDLILEFRNQLAKIYADVFLPLANIKAEGKNFAFDLNFTI